MNIKENSSKKIDENKKDVATALEHLALIGAILLGIYFCTLL